ncbi:hypothetical protein PG997_005718 [Apiospora hydei]|uniref:Uncharacterized protein n=1 Tax=Apiospora hydei TaxID=1337664 RepID=A0ABR1WLT7_9PEZI
MPSVVPVGIFQQTGYRRSWPLYDSVSWGGAIWGRLRRATIREPQSLVDDRVRVRRLLPARDINMR